MRVTLTGELVCTGPATFALEAEKVELFGDVEVEIGQWLLPKADWTVLYLDQDMLMHETSLFGDHFVCLKKLPVAPAEP